MGNCPLLKTNKSTDSNERIHLGGNIMVICKAYLKYRKLETQSMLYLFYFLDEFQGWKLIKNKLQKLLLKNKSATCTFIRKSRASCDVIRKFLGEQPISIRHWSVKVAKLKHTGKSAHCFKKKESNNN